MYFCLALKKRSRFSMRYNKNYFNNKPLYDHTIILLRATEMLILLLFLVNILFLIVCK